MGERMKWIKSVGVMQCIQWLAEWNMKSEYAVAIVVCL